MSLLPRLQSLASTVSPRCVAPVFGVLVFVYIVIYLLWTNPASHPTMRRRHDVVAPAQDKEMAETHVLGDVQPQAFASHWKGVWIPGRSIQVMSAILDIHHGGQQVRVALPAFLRHSSNREFFCCFHWSDDAREFVQVPAQLDYIDLRYIVELQSAAFECIVKDSEVKDLQRIQHVSFASKSCDLNPTLPLRIFTPPSRKFEFAVCTKVAYGRLDPQRLLEWFTFMELMGVSKVLTFYNNLHADSMRVMQYFVETGLLELIEFDPRNSKGKSVKYTSQNAQTRQAQHDKTLAVRDCQYRLGGYDFVMTIDFDELPVPRRPYGSINWVLQDLSRNYSDAAAFKMEPVLLPPDWHTHEDTLYHWQFTSGARIAPVCNKWVYRPARSWMAATHEVLPKEGFNMYVVPPDVLHFLHFRSCKAEWKRFNCSNLSRLRIEEDSLMRFGDRVIDKLRKLPLEELVPQSGSSSYARSIREDHRARHKSFDRSILLDFDT